MSHARYTRRAIGRATLLTTALVTLAAGCPERVDTLQGMDASLDATDATGPGPGACAATLAEVCADPARYDGCELHILAPVAAFTVGTAVGCTCCNANHTSFAFACPPDGSGMPDDALAIVFEDDGSPAWTEVHGVVVDPTVGNSNLHALIESSRTRLGCVGQECYEVCTPAPADQIVGARGRLVYEPPNTSMLYGRRHLVVHAVDLADGGVAP